jgi:hypothetical protein
MLDFVFETASIRLRGVAPIMFCDELAERALGWKKTRSLGFNSY